MNSLDTSINNPWFAGYAIECEKEFDLQEKIESITNECGNTISANLLTEKLKEKGIDPESLTPCELNLIDKFFECY